jgi:hypothetical protein
MELWLSVSEKQGVGCKLELRLFHALEDSASADEYLFSKIILVATPPTCPSCSLMMRSSTN